MSIYKKTTFLISGTHLIYKNKIYFLVFLKYGPSSHGFNKLDIKAQNAC
jgi:hypothetical protein